MTLQKLDPARVQLPEKLYRGENQWKFEFAALESMFETDKASYWGHKNRYGEKITFCARTVFETIYFTQRDTKAENEENIFTYSPLIVEIDTSNYNLYQPVKGEGYVIKGPVSLDDITILYSSKKNNLPFLPQSMIDELDNTRTGKDLFKQYEEKTDSIEGYIKMALGSGSQQNLRGYMETLRAKLE